MALFSQTLTGNYAHDVEIMDDFLNELQTMIYEFTDCVVYQSTEPTIADMQASYSLALGEQLPILPSNKVFWYNPSTGFIEDVYFVQDVDNTLNYVDPREHVVFVLYKKQFTEDFVGAVYTEVIPTTEDYDGMMTMVTFRSTRAVTADNSHIGFYATPGTAYYGHDWGWDGSGVNTRAARAANDGVWVGLTPTFSPAGSQPYTYFKGMTLFGMGFGRTDVVKALIGYHSNVNGGASGITINTQISAHFAGYGIELTGKIDEFSIDTVTGIAKGTQVVILGFK